MNECEAKLLASLDALSMSQSQTTQALARVSEQQVQISGVLMRLSEHQTSTWRQHETHGQALSVLSGHQQATSEVLKILTMQQAQILAALSKAPEGDSIIATLEELLKPLAAALSDLSRRLPPPPDK